MKMSSRLALTAMVIVLSTPSFGRGAGAEVKAVSSPADLAPGFSTLARKGDLLITDGKFIALLGTSARQVVTSANYPYGQAMGSILALSPVGQAFCGDLNFGMPAVRLGDKTRYPVYSRIDRVPAGAASGPLSFSASGFYEDKEGRTAAVRTAYRIDPSRGLVEVSSTLTNSGRAAFEDLSYSLFFDAYHHYSFRPYDEEKFPALNFRVYQKKGFHLALLDLNPAEKDDVRFPGKLAPGEKCEVRYVLFVDSSALGLLEKIYGFLNVPAVRGSASFKDYEGDWLELIVRDALTSAVFYRAVLEKPAYEEFLVPPGFYRVQANFFPAVAGELVEVKPEGENDFLLQCPPLGELTVRLQDSKGDPVPGKVSFLGISPTQSPYFRPDNPIETGRDWEGFKNSCFPGKEGTTIQIPAGTYLASASRGPEYSADHRALEILKGKNPELVLVIDRVVETPGLLSFDPHMHTNRSDADPSVSERIKSVVAEGIEVMSATDHNTITDYTPYLNGLGLAGELTVLPGSEVTTPDVIHYNTYPMELRPGELGNGAINSAAETASPLFAASRKKNPGAVVQVNHPRAGDLGYFNNTYLDQDSAATARPDLDLSFDVLEVINGPYFYSSNQTAIEDWFHLLNRGYFFPIVGSSDCHGIDREEPGYSRTYVSLPDEKAKPLNRAAFLEALKKGRSFVTNGPLVDLRVNSRYTPGDLAAAKEGKVHISVRIWGAPWVEVEEVRLVLNGERRIVLPIRADAGAIEKLTPEKPLDIRIADNITLTRDATLCVEVLGGKTLFPVVQRLNETGLPEDGTLPYALTNPVFIDVDGNGRFDPPLPEKVLLMDNPVGSNKKISRD